MAIHGGQDTVLATCFQHFNSTYCKSQHNPHPFHAKKPELRSLIFSFCNGNPAQFHALDGSGYAFWAEQVLAQNKLNPQVAARLVRTLDHWQKYKPALKK